VVNGPQASNVTLEYFPQSECRRTYSRKKEEYIADFCLVSRRVLDEEEYRIFRFHFLLGADWRLCVRQLRIDRGSFFHFVYRIEQKLGQTFANLKPYALYPLDQYFGGTIRKERVQPFDPPPATRSPQIIYMKLPTASSIPLAEAA